MKTTDETSIAVIQTNIEYIKKDINGILTSIKDLSNVYATQIALDNVKSDITKLQHASTLWKFLTPTISAVFSSIFTFLTLQYLTHLK